MNLLFRYYGQLFDIKGILWFASDEFIFLDTLYSALTIIFDISFVLFKRQKNINNDIKDVKIHKRHKLGLRHSWWKDAGPWFNKHIIWDDSFIILVNSFNSLFQYHKPIPRYLRGIVKLHISRLKILG